MIQSSFNTGLCSSIFAEYVCVHLWYENKKIMKQFAVVTKLQFERRDQMIEGMDEWMYEWINEWMDTGHAVGKIQLLSLKFMRILICSYKEWY